VPVDDQARVELALLVLDVVLQARRAATIHVADQFRVTLLPLHSDRIAQRITASILVAA